MPPDPFAVRDYRLDDLPVLRTTARADFETGDVRVGRNTYPGFGKVWVAHMGGVEGAISFLRQAFGPVEGRIGMRSVELRNGFSAEAEWVERFRHDAPGRGDWLERNLALMTLIEHEGGHVPRAILLKVLPVALGVAAQRRKLNGARLREFVFAASPRPSNATVKRLAGRFGLASPQTVRNHRQRPTIAAHRQALEEVRDAALARGETPMVTRGHHAADPWFAQHIEDQLAQALYDEALRYAGEHGAPFALRWDLLHLVEGYAFRRTPLPPVVMAALDATLGLVDAEGKPRRLHKGRFTYPAVSLGGVARRELFMQMALFEAGLRSGESEIESVATERRWAELPIFQTALDIL